MELEIWWLLGLPLFFALGWFAARVDMRQAMSESRAVPKSYFKGLNFLLSEQPDRAIESFIEVVKVDEDTLDLHFALGSLFRKRGELERAIRLHENIVERDDLDQEQRLHALHELGEDYLKAGLLDRAGEVFARLLDTPRALDARHALLEIRVQERDWAQAIELARRLGHDSTRPYQTEIAHYCCEMALEKSARGELTTARELLTQACATQRPCVRASLMLGDLDASAGDHEAALAHWRAIEAASPTHLPLAIERIWNSYKAADRSAEGVAWLTSLMSRLPSQDLFNTLYLATLETQGAETAYRLARQELTRAPSLRVAERLLDAEALKCAGEHQQDMLAVKALLVRHAQQLTRYQCGHCGFKARQFFWRCPACGAWDGFDPQRVEA
jgi:lipopolysaccharide biosynthesis regulator YciM